MARAHKNRCWYIGRCIGSDKIEFLVSAFSERQVRKAIKHTEPMYKVSVALAWQLSKVFSGVPFLSSHIEDLAPQDFIMDNEGESTCVIVLS